MPGELKVATVESVESIDNMATLPVSLKQHSRSEATPEQNNSTNREMEAKKDKKQGKDKDMDMKQPQHQQTKR